MNKTLKLVRKVHFPFETEGLGGPVHQAIKLSRAIYSVRLHWVCTASVEFQGEESPPHLQEAEQSSGVNVVELKSLQLQSGWDEPRPAEAHEVFTCSSSLRPEEAAPGELRGRQREMNNTCACD